LRGSSSRNSLPSPGVLATSIRAFSDCAARQAMAGARALARRVALNVAAVHGRYHPDLETGYQFSARPGSA
jgi:hypothetical protein